MPAIWFKTDILGQKMKFMNFINQAFFNILDIPLEASDTPKKIIEIGEKINLKLIAFHYFYWNWKFT